MIVVENTNSASAIGVKSVRPTWFEDIVTTKEPTSHAEQEQHEPMHGLKLVVKEEALLRMMSKHIQILR